MKYFLLITVIIFTLIHCSTKNSETSRVTIDFNMENPHSRAMLTDSRSLTDINVITVAVRYDGKYLSDPVRVDMTTRIVTLNVPVGRNRTFIAKAFVNNDLQYKGETTMDVLPGSDNVVAIVMERVSFGDNNILNLAFKDIDLGFGHIAGTLTLQAPADESNYTGYNFYWGDKVGNKMESLQWIGHADATGTDITMNIAADTLLATAEGTKGYFLVFAVGADQETDLPVGGALKIIDDDGGIDYVSEGTIDNPILIPADGSMHSAQVANGMPSYYYTEAIDNVDAIQITISNLSDDVDIWSCPRGTSQTFDSGRCTMNNIGLTTGESISFSDFNYPSDEKFYFYVDGSDTGLYLLSFGGNYDIQAKGVNYSLTVCSPQGLISEPVDVLSGYALNTETCMGIIPNYYRVKVEPGKEYIAYKSSSYVGMDVFQNEDFSTGSVDPTSFVASGEYIYIRFTNQTTMGGDESTYYHVVTSHGTAVEPIAILPEKTNYSQVNGGASYYIMQLAPNTEYTMDCDLNNAMNIELYDGVDFQGEAYSSLFFELLNLTPLPFMTGSNGYVGFKVITSHSDGEAYSIRVYSILAE